MSAERDRAANLLGALGVALYDDLDRTMAQAGSLPLGEATALNLVGHAPGCSIRYVSEALSISHAGAVRMIDRLEERALVQRGPGPDGRTVALRLTSAGRRRWRRQLEARARRLSDLVDGVGADDRHALTEVAERILGALTTDRSSAVRTCRTCDIASCPQDRCPVEGSALLGVPTR